MGAVNTIISGGLLQTTLLQSRKVNKNCLPDPIHVHTLNDVRRTTPDSSSKLSRALEKSIKSRKVNKSVPFSFFQIQFAHDWIGAWSVVCLFSCLFTLATFLADIGRFPYPERPIIYLTLCYCAIAVIFLVGYGFQEDIACNHAVENRSLNFMTEKTIRQVGKLT